MPSMHLVFRSIRRALLYIALSIAAFVSIFPFYWMVVGSTNSSPDIAHGKITPGTYLFENIAAFFATVDVPRMFWNSTFLALVGVALTLTVSSLAGYGFEVFKSRFRDRIFGLLLLTLSIPFAALMVPLFIMMSQLKLINTFAAVLLPGIASVFIIFYFRQATKAFPGELRDAARIDGLNEWQIFAVRLPAGDALDLCGGDHHHLHVELEQLPLAADHPSDRAEQDRDADRLVAPLRLRAGLRRDHDQRRVRNAAHGSHLLPSAAALRRRPSGLGQIAIMGNCAQ